MEVVMEEVMVMLGEDKVAMAILVSNTRLKSAHYFVLQNNGTVGIN